MNGTTLSGGSPTEEESVSPRQDAEIVDPRSYACVVLAEPRHRTGNLPAYRALLEEQWGAQLAEVTRLSVLMHSARDAGGDGSRTEAMRVTAQLAAAARQQLDETEAALRRIDNGEYGLCGRCEQPVTLERLEALPAARYCLPCQQAQSRARS